MDNKEFPEMQKNQKREYKFNIIDAMLILIILAAAAVLVYILAGNNVLAGNEDAEILYTIEIPLIKNEFISAVNKITAGMKITDSVRSYDIGEIQEVKVDAAYTNSRNLETGVVERKPYPNFSRVTITAKAKCTSGKGGYIVNGKVIMVGVKIDFRTQYLINYGYCIDIKELTGAKKEDKD